MDALRSLFARDDGRDALRALAGLLIVVAPLLILAGTRFGYRGPTYVGAIGLFIFVIVVGLDLRSEDPENSILGWPLVLLILGAIAFAVSMIPGLRIRLTLEQSRSP